MSRSVLVTGSHRSGTTWVGRMLAHAPGVLYVHEPFNVTDPPGPGLCDVRFEHWFTHIGTFNESRYYAPLRDTVELRYRLGAALRAARSPRAVRRAIRELLVVTAHRLRGARVLVKDPLALLSAEWLAERFEMAVVVLIRHPAAFASSLMRLGWSHPFADFARQQQAMDGLLRPFAAEIERFAAAERPLLDQAILLWNVLHHVIDEYRYRHPKWIFIRHEDVSRAPLAEFQALYERLGLKLTERARDAIRAHTDAANPIDEAAPVGSEKTLQRDSRGNIWQWQQRLSAEEITRIAVGTENVWRRFYTDEDWRAP